MLYMMDENGYIWGQICTISVNFEQRRMGCQGDGGKRTAYVNERSVVLECYPEYRY